MAATVTVQWYGERVQKQIRTEMTRRLRRVTTDIKTAVVRNISVSARKAVDGREGTSLAGEFPRAKARMLSRSIFGELEDDNTGIIGVAKSSPARKYARRLEEGGVIRSHGKNMAVPLSAAAKRHSENGGGPRNFDRPMVPIHRRGKPTLLVEIPPKDLAGGQGVRPWIIHYLLTPKVDIAARPYLARTLLLMTPHTRRVFEEPMSL